MLVKKQSGQAGSKYVFVLCREICFTWVKVGLKDKQR